MNLLRHKQQWQFNRLKQWLKTLDGSYHLASFTALTYAVLSFLWIAESDNLLAMLAPSVEDLTLLQTLKGWFFVGCTSLLLYGLIYRGVRRLQQKHHLLQSIINSTNDVVYVRDAKGQFLIVNQSIAPFLGVHPADVLGKKIEDFFVPEEAQRIRSLEQEIFRTGQAQEIEELLTIQGESRWFSTTRSLCLDERSHPIGIVGISRDITQRKQAESIIRDNEERLRLALTAAKQGLYDLNVQTGKAIVNEEYAMMLGYDPVGFDETNGRWIERLHPDDREAVANVYRAYIAGEIPDYRVEFRQRSKNGDWKWILSLGKVIAWDETGQPLRMLGTHTDISDRKQAEAELRRSTQLQFELHLLENILEVILAGYWDWDIAGNREYLSPTFKRMFGYEAHELPDTPGIWKQLIFAEDLPGITACFEQHVTSRGEVPYHNEVRYRHKNGATIWVICCGHVIQWGADGSPLRMVGCHIDITARKQAEEALRESERRYATLTEAAPVAICQFDAAGYCVYANERWSEMTGLPAEVALGMGWLRTLPPEDRDRVSVEWFRALQQTGSFQSESRCLLPDGNIIWFYAQVVPETDTNGKIFGYIGTLTDITACKQAEEQLRFSNEQISLANAELARATRLKDEFLANMSHELRTPLTAILGMSDMLKAELYGPLNEKQHQYIEVISQSGNHLLTLINDILDLAKIESGKMELEIASTSIDTLCKSSLSFIKQMAYQKNIQLKTQISTNIAEIDVDERRIRQALINLLSNAVKFTPAGGQIILEVKHGFPAPLCQHNQPVIEFSVIDTGIGIATEDMPKLFHSFVQVDSKLNRQYSGTGLGLALVKKIVELHQGTVEVTSTLGQGSCFTMALPGSNHYHLMPVQPFQSELDRRSKRTAPGGETTATAATSPLILLAEDNQANIDTFSTYLTNFGFRVITAMNGQEAVDLAKSQQPDIILMDIQMPVVDGLEAIRRIRADQTLADVPIIALTALAMTGDREKCLAAGATEYFSKPISLKQLRTLIQQLSL